MAMIVMVRNELDCCVVIVKRFSAAKVLQKKQIRKFLSVFLHVKKKTANYLRI